MIFFLFLLAIAKSQTSSCAKKTKDKLALIEARLPNLPWPSVLLLATLSSISTLAFLGFGESNPSSTASLKDPANCAYIPGAGFSGFPFAMGTLQNAADPTSIDYYCFSAGCLAATAALSGAPTEKVVDIAVDSQDKWKNGTISRYQFVETLVDNLVSKRVFRRKTLSKLHIITATPTWRGLKTVVRTPTSAEELREMLVQTTWIPTVTGDGLTHKEHLDGAFTSILAGSNPYCSNTVKLPTELSWDGLDFFANSLNMALTRDNFLRFIELGNNMKYRVF